METLVQQLAAQRYYCTPESHDQAVALISHLPVYLSAALILTAMTGGNLAQNLASSGFADTSRVGGGNPQLGLQMARHNRVALMTALAYYQNHLTQLQTALTTEDWAALEAALTFTQQARQSFLKD